MVHLAVVRQPGPPDAAYHVVCTEGRLVASLKRAHLKFGSERIVAIEVVIDIQKSDDEKSNSHHDVYNCGLRISDCGFCIRFQATSVLRQPSLAIPKSEIRNPQCEGPR